MMSEYQTVAELLRKAESAACAWRSVEAEEAVKERPQREREPAVARAMHLDTLRGREPALWRQVNDLIATKHPKRCSEAVEFLVDLQAHDDRAARQGRIMMETSVAASRSREYAV